MIELLGDHDIAVIDIDGFPHPLSAVYRKTILPHVQALLAGDRLRPADLFDALRTRRVRPSDVAAVDPDLLTLRNLNTPEEYREALKQVTRTTAVALRAGSREAPDNSGI